jgi:hypothetical protein
MQPHIDAEMLAEPMPFDCEHVVDSGFGWLAHYDGEVT